MYFSLCLSTVFTRMQSWLPVNRNSPKLVEMISIKVLILVWCLFWPGSLQELTVNFSTSGPSTRTPAPHGPRNLQRDFDEAAEPTFGSPVINLAEAAIIMQGLPDTQRSTRYNVLLEKPCTRLIDRIQLLLVLAIAVP